MGAVRDLVDLLRWSRAQPRPSLGDALASGAQATRDLRDYQDALARGVVDAQNGVPTTALVESLRALPAVAEGPARTEVVLLLDVPGGAPVRVVRAEVLPRAVAVGERLPVRVLRFDPQRFAVEWEAGRA